MTVDRITSESTKVRTLHFDIDNTECPGWTVVLVVSYVRESSAQVKFKTYDISRKESDGVRYYADHGPELSEGNESICGFLKSDGCFQWNAQNVHTDGFKSIKRVSQLLEFVYMSAMRFMGELGADTYCDD